MEHLLVLATAYFRTSARSLKMLIFKNMFLRILVKLKCSALFEIFLS